MKRKTLVSFFKYILLIMLLQLSHFPLFIPLHPSHPLLPTFPPFSSCLWVVHISSLASTFPILFLTSPYFVPTIYTTYPLYIFPLSPLPTPPLITLHVISISVSLFLFQLFAQFVFVFLGSVVDGCEFVVILLFIFLIIFFFLDKHKKDPGSSEGCIM